MPAGISHQPRQIGLFLHNKTSLMIGIVPESIRLCGVHRAAERTAEADKRGTVEKMPSKRLEGSFTSC